MENKKNKKMRSSSVDCFNLIKNEECQLPRTMERVLVGCGWDPHPARDGDKFDVDLSCLLLNARGELIEENAFVYFNNLTYHTDKVVHTGDSLTGEGDGDDERLLIDLSRVPGDVQRIPILCTIYDGARRQQTFGMISNAFIRIVDITKLERGDHRLREKTSLVGEDFCRLAINETGMMADALVFGELVRTSSSGSWKFVAVEKEIFGGLRAFLNAHAVSSVERVLTTDRRLVSSERRDSRQQLYSPHSIGAMVVQHPIAQRIRDRKLPLMVLGGIAVFSQLGVGMMCLIAAVVVIAMG